MQLLNLLARAFASGTGAAIASGAVASREGVNNGSSAVAPINAVAHCVWPAEAMLDERASVRLTGTGAFIHWGASVFWGLLFESLRGRRASTAAIVRAAGITAVTA